MKQVKSIAIVLRSCIRNDIVFCVTMIHMTSGGLKGYRYALILNMIVSVLSFFVYPSISNGIMVSTLFYFIYLWLLNYGISKALDDKDRHQIYMVLIMNVIFIALIVMIGFILGDIFSIFGILFGLLSCKILYMLGIVRG